MKKKFCIVGIDPDLIDFIKQNYKNFLGYFSNRNRHYKLINKDKWLGEHNIKNWQKIKKKYNPSVIINIDDGKKREELIKEIYQKNCVNLFLTNSHISKTSKSNLVNKMGILIQSHAKIMPCVNLGEGTKIHINAQIHHDCAIGKFVTIAPSAVLLGNVKVGSYSYIGANCTIKQNINIGKNATVGAAAMVTKDVKDFDTVVGQPAKSIKNN